MTEEECADIIKGRTVNLFLRFKDRIPYVVQDHSYFKVSTGLDKADLSACWLTVITAMN
jgi:hypothetical protein